MKCGRRFYFMLPPNGKRYRYFSDDNLTKVISDEEKQIAQAEQSSHDIPRGEWLYGMKHRVTREYKYVTAPSIDEGLKKLGWEFAPTWALPLKYGGDPIKEGETPVKQDEWLYGITHREEKKSVNQMTDEEIVSSLEEKGITLPIKEIGVDLASPSGENTIVTSKEGSVVVKNLKKIKREASKPTIKSLVIEVLKQEPQIGKEAVLDKIFQILKTKAVEKGGRSDDEHLHKRANLTYYFYSKAVS